MNNPVNTVAYLYDTDGIRVQTVTDGTVVTNYLVDKNRPYTQVLEERDGSGGLTVSYIYGDDLISQDRSGVDSYYHYDGQMSTRALTDAAEAVTDTYKYDAFGNLLDQTGTTLNNYLYTGEQYDPNTGFYYLRARYYDTGIGRFITRDPWQGSAFDPITLHKYLYAGTDPVNNWDPSGQQTTTYDTLITLGMVSALSCIAMTYISIPEVNLPMQNVELHFDLYQYLNSAGNWWDNLWSQDSAGHGSLTLDDINDMSDAARELDPADRGGELTKAGRALEKHGGRPGSAFPKATGNSAAKNAQGQAIVDEILNNPDSTTNRNGLGGIDVRSPDGRGIRYTGDGSLYGFLEP